MASSNKERQAKYRANRATAGPKGDGERRLEFWIASAAYFALGRVAKHRKLTKRAVLEALILREDDQIARSPDTSENLDPHLIESEKK